MLQDEELIVLFKYVDTVRNKTTENLVNISSRHYRRPDILAYDIEQVFKAENESLDREDLMQRFAVLDTDKYSDVYNSFTYFPLKQDTIDIGKIDFMSLLSRVIRKPRIQPPLLTKEMFGF